MSGELSEREQLCVIDDGANNIAHVLSSFQHFCHMAYIHEAILSSELLNAIYLLELYVFFILLFFIICHS